MAITPYGFDGSLDEAKWATMWQIGTTANHVLGTNDFRVTAVAGYRQVAVAAGSAFSRGVLAVNDATVNLTLTAPTAGQWWLIANLVDWNANTVTPVAIPGATTTATTPANIPTSFPTGYLSTAGATAHHALAWVFTSISSTSLAIVDIRTRTPAYANQGIWGPYGGVPSGPAGARDLWYNIATNNTTIAGRNYLQGAMWYNTDTSRLERWYGLYNASTNAGGSTSPGWYPATTYDNYSGNGVVSSSDEANGVRINPGSQANICNYVIGVTIPTWVSIRLDVNASPNSTSSSITAAGNISFTLNGDLIGGTKRLHTHASSGNMWHQMSIDTRALLLPGNNTITARLSTDSSSSVAWSTAEAKIIVWKE